MSSSHSRVRLLRTPLVFPDLKDAAGGSGANDVVRPSADREDFGTKNGSPGANDLELIRRAEYLRGVADGERKAAATIRSEQQSELAAEKNRVNALVEEVRDHLSTLYKESEEAVLKFAFGVAEKIIRREVGLDRGIVLGNIKESVRRVLGVERVTIRVHPGDLASVREKKSIIQANGDSIREIVVEADEGLNPGDCVLESEMGNIDARISTQLKQIENMLFESKVVSQ